MLVLVPRTGHLSLAVAKSKGLIVWFSFFFCFFVSGNNSTIILLPRLVTSEASLHPPFPSLPFPNQSLNPSDSVFSTPRTSLLSFHYLFHLDQQSPTFLALGTSVVEGNFPTDWRVGMVWGWFKCITFIVHFISLACPLVTSCCAAWFLTGHRWVPWWDPWSRLFHQHHNWPPWFPITAESSSFRARCILLNYSFIQIMILKNLWWLPIDSRLS